MTREDVSELSVEDDDLRWMRLVPLGVCGTGVSLMRAVAFSGAVTSTAAGGFSVRKEGKHICVIIKSSGQRLWQAVVTYEEAGKSQSANALDGAASLCAVRKKNHQKNIMLHKSKGDIL